MEDSIEISKGKIVLMKPTAKVRNDALIEAEKIGGENPSKTVFITSLLPKCIKSHPFGTTPLRQALESLDYDEYDKVSNKLSELMKPKGDIEKKSSQQ